MNVEQRELLDLRRAGFDDWLAERLPLLRDFAAALEIPNPAFIVAEPRRYLLSVDTWLKEQVVDSADHAWIAARVAYFVGELLIERFGGYWFVCDNTSSRFFGRYVVGGFRQIPNSAAMVDPVDVAVALVSEPPGRSLVDIYDRVCEELSNA